VNEFIGQFHSKVEEFIKKQKAVRQEQGRQIKALCENNVEMNNQLVISKVSLEKMATIECLLTEFSSIQSELEKQNLADLDLITRELHSHTNKLQLTSSRISQVAKMISTKALSTTYDRYGKKMESELGKSVVLDAETFMEETSDQETPTDSVFYQDLLLKRTDLVHMRDILFQKISEVMNTSQLFRHLSSKKIFQDMV